MSAISSNPIELFISYAREDKTDKEELIKHLHTLIDEKKISIWHDGEIIPGQEWNEAIIGHLNSSQIILLLISPDFISSDFINKVEKTRAMERYKAREARVIPVILRSADWKTTPIHALEALPEGALPVNEWPNRDKAFLDIVTGIRKVLDSLPPLEASQHSGSAGNMDVDMEEHINDSIYVRPGSKVFPSGHFSNIDTIHVHVDGGTSRELVAAIVDQLDNKRVDSKITYVTRYIAGPQRADLPQVYRSHTPGTSREQLQFFSTTLFSSLSDAKVKLTEILARLSEHCSSRFLSRLVC
jgi:hypothetical protein